VTFWNALTGTPRRLPSITRLCAASLRISNPTGNSARSEIRLEPLRAASGEITGVLGVGIDITDGKKNEELVLYQARHDALTGLANYREFMERLEGEVCRAERSHHAFTLCCWISMG